MSTSSNAEHFFQTSDSLAESDRKRRKANNTFGQPIKFPSKLLGISVDKYFAGPAKHVLIAEADGSVSAIDLHKDEIARVGRSGTAPMTCITSYSGQLSQHDNNRISAVISGGWDKYITRHIVNEPGHIGPSNVSQGSFKAHNDFLKCLLVAATPDKRIVLLSGGADGDVNIWTFTGEKLGSIKPQSRGIECLALDPFSTADAPMIFFSTSQREIYSFYLPAIADMKKIQLSAPIVQHETSVYKLAFDNDGDLWTASADKTAKRLVRENNFTADTTFAHPDFVRDIVLYEPSSLAITACRDEEIRVWNTGTGQLLHIFTGHYEEVTGLGITGNILLSISIDATLRRWSLAPNDLAKAIEETKNPKLTEEEPEPKNDFGGLTEEEEAELQALMEEEEADTLEKMAVDLQ